jgi:CheY-like chemotaxis protein
MSTVANGEPRGGGDAIHLLIAEDDAASRELLMALVEGLRHPATAVSNGAAAPNR